MKTEQQIRETLNKLLADERLYYHTATIFENSPLALIQLSLETHIHALEDVLQLPKTNFAKLRKE